MMAYRYAKIKNDLHGIALKGGSNMPCGLGLLAHFEIWYASSKRVTDRNLAWFVDTMFFEDISRDERHFVNGLFEFGGHASRSNGYEANSVGGGRYLPRAIGGTGFLQSR